MIREEILNEYKEKIQGTDVIISGLPNQKEMDQMAIGIFADKLVSFVQQKSQHIKVKKIIVKY